MIEFTPWMLGLLALYWIIHRGDGVLVADGLALNWAVNQGAVMFWVQAGWGGPPVFMFWVVDFLTAAWMALYIHSELSMRVAKWFVPMLALNAVIWALGTTPTWHYYTLLALAFAQALTVMAGLWGHGILAFYHHTRDGLRDKLADATSFITGAKR